MRADRGALLLEFSQRDLLLFEGRLRLDPRAANSRLVIGLLVHQHNLSLLFSSHLLQPCELKSVLQLRTSSVHGVLLLLFIDLSDFLCFVENLDRAFDLLGGFRRLDCEMRMRIGSAIVVICDLAALSFLQQAIKVLFNDLLLSVKLSRVLIHVIEQVSLLFF